MFAGTAYEAPGAADAAADAGGAAELALEGGVVAPPEGEQAARKAALADIALAHRKPRRLSGVRSSCKRIWRTYFSISWSVTIDLLLPVDPGPVDLTRQG